MANDTTIIHVTHETVGKIGGIGAVLQGFFTCKSYLDKVNRSILVGPLFTIEGSVLDRLGEGGEVLYSSVDGLLNPGYSPAFHKIEKFYNVGIVYGRRRFVDPATGITSLPEVLLIDVRQMDKGVVNEFKKRLYEEFGIRSHLYEYLWEYEQYIRLAPAAIAALKAIGALTDSASIIAHEFMGLPTVLAAILEADCQCKTAFYAHEVATMRRVVEEHPGHDTMFYNVIKQAHKDRLDVNEVFGDQSSYFKHGIIEASKYCDRIFAVGDIVVDELRFLAREFETADIDIVYNGVPAYQISVDEKLASKSRLQRYCKNLLGYKPDFVFTHVTRLVKSKGLWRDLRVLYTLEDEFRARDKTAVLFVLSTEVSQRRSQDIYNMESCYDWPVAHRENWPDLSGGEAHFYTLVQRFNARSRNIKIVFINQFGFKSKYCGKRMPEDMEFMDIRKGSDVEFGQSIYEPFGISQVETLTFGGICVVSSVCGCLGFLRDVTKASPTSPEGWTGSNRPSAGWTGADQPSAGDVKNVIVADYTNLDNYDFADIEDLLQIGWPVRDRTEARVSQEVAREIINRLPGSETEIGDMIQIGYRLAGCMSWDIVVNNYLLNSLQKTSPKVRVW